MLGEGGGGGFTLLKSDVCDACGCTQAAARPTDLRIRLGQEPVWQEHLPRTPQHRLAKEGSREIVHTRQDVHSHGGNRDVGGAGKAAPTLELVRAEVCGSKQPTRSAHNMHTTRSHYVHTLRAHTTLHTLRAHTTRTHYYAHTASVMQPIRSAIPIVDDTAPW